MHLLSVVLVFAFLAVPVAEACFAAGVCGGGCPPPMPAPSCSGGCGYGYGCGQYGCHRKARVASSRTLKISSDEEDSKAAKANLSPDQKFLQCCIDRNLPDSCLNKCSYRSYTRDALQQMYFRVDSCPMQAASDIHYCAAQGSDHRQCCMRNGVASTIAGPKCLLFCDQRPGNVTQLDFSYMACFDRFDSMKSCFWNGITQNVRVGGRRN